MLAIFYTSLIYPYPNILIGIILALRYILAKTIS